jgi:hypothetical protein
VLCSKPTADTILPRAAPIFLNEVLARPLALNAERNVEEVRLGIASGMKGKKEQDEGEDEE